MRENAGRICLLLLRYHLGAPEFVTPAANAEWGHRIQRRKGMLRSRVIGAPSASHSCYKEQRGWPTPVEASQSSVADGSFVHQSTPFAWLLECRRASLEAQMVKNLPAIQETWVRSLGWEEPLKKGITTHSSILASRIAWTEEPGGLLSEGSQRVAHD